jgi:3-isopropylmalate dehydrogenase
MSASTTPPTRDATIALLPGDGIGPEVVAAARLVLEAVADRHALALHFTVGLIGGAAIDATGNPLPDDTIAGVRNADAVFLGAVGGPAWDNPSAAVRPEQGLLRLRRELGAFANLRPVAPYPSLAYASPLRPELLKDVDLVVVRELTGGIYFGEKTLDTVDGGEVARDVCTYSTVEIERVVRVAAELARTRRKRLTSVDKANILETSRLWRRTTTRIIESEYPDLQLEHMLVDTAAMRLIQRPADFDVIVTENTFGDILTDEAAVLAGSIGLLPSASLGANTGDGRCPGLYEPIHGSAPDIAGKGLANPIGAIASAAMLLRHSLGLEGAARAVEDAVRQTIVEGTLTADIAAPGKSAVSTGAVAARVCDFIRA